MICRSYDVTYEVGRDNRADYSDHRTANHEKNSESRPEIVTEPWNLLHIDFSFMKTRASS